MITDTLRELRSVSSMASRDRPFAEVDPEEVSDESLVSPAATCAAPADICEDEIEYLITVEVPGVNVADITVKAVEGVLKIEAEISLSAAEQGHKYLRIERELGRCQRLFDLPADADIQLMRYDVLDGVLRVFIPKIDPSPAAIARPTSIHSKTQKSLPEPPPTQVDLTGS